MAAPKRKSDIDRIVYHEYGDKAYDDVAVVSVDLYPFLRVWRNTPSSFINYGTNRRHVIVLLRADIHAIAITRGFRVISDPESEILRLIYIPEGVAPVAKWNAVAFNRYRRDLRVFNQRVLRWLTHEDVPIMYVRKALDARPVRPMFHFRSLVRSLCWNR